MNIPYGQLNFSLNIDLDIKAQKETEANGIERQYNLKVAKHLNI